MDFDPGPDVAELPYEDWRRAFVAKYDADGAFLWARAIEGTDITVHTDSRRMRTVMSMSWAVSGGTATFGDTDLTSRGEKDIFLAKLDSDGNFLWAVRAGSDGRGRRQSVSRWMPMGIVYVVGTLRRDREFWR